MFDLRYLVSYFMVTTFYVLLDLINFKVLPFRDAYASFYKDAFTTPTNYVAAFFVYTLYPLSILYSTISVTRGETIRKGAVLGLTGYGLYHLTNGATFPSWDWGVAAYDTAWGTMLTMFLSWVAYEMMRAFKDKV